jgi:hypothetical protein
MAVSKACPSWISRELAGNAIEKQAAKQRKRSVDFAITDPTITSLVASRKNFGSGGWGLADERESLVVLGHSTAASFKILEKHDFREQVEVTSRTRIATDGCLRQNCLTNQRTNGRRSHVAHHRM